MKLGFKLILKTFGYLRMKFKNYTGFMLFLYTKLCAYCVYIVADRVVDKTGIPVTSTIWSISTYVVSV